MRRIDTRLQEAVWRRARDRCEYCQFPARLTRVPFQIDHLVAEKHGGRTTSNNLALSCFFCNTYKGPNIAGIDQRTGEVTRLFHPRRDQWSEHFRWNEAVLEGVTAVGRVTTEVLRINDEDAVAVRRMLFAEGAW